MARCIVVLCIMTAAAAAVATAGGKNRLALYEGCNEACAADSCGAPKHYVTGECVRESDAASYRAECGDNGWSIADYIDSTCSTKGSTLEGSSFCQQSNEMVAVKIQSIAEDVGRVTARVCESDATDKCTDGVDQCAEKTLAVPSKTCLLVEENGFFYRLKIEGDNDSKKVTLSLFKTKNDCEDNKMATFIGADMTVNRCKAYKKSIKATCTPLTKTNTLPTTTGTETTGTETAGTETTGTETAGTETAGTETAGTETAGTETAGTETTGSNGSNENNNTIDGTTTAPMGFIIIGIAIFILMAAAL